MSQCWINPPLPTPSVASSLDHCHSFPTALPEWQAAFTRHVPLLHQHQQRLCTALLSHGMTFGTITRHSPGPATLQLHLPLVLFTHDGLSFPPTHRAYSSLYIFSLCLECSFLRSSQDHCYLNLGSMLPACMDFLTIQTKRVPPPISLFSFL